MTSQVGQSHLCTSCHVFGMSQFRQSHLGNSWYNAVISQIGRFHLGTNERLQRRPKQVHLINVQVVTS